MKKRTLMEYVGEIIDDDERNRRKKMFMDAYMMGLPGDRFIDSYSTGNHSRFVNHACAAKANAVSVLVDVKGEVRVAIISLREIENGEEITMDYLDPDMSFECRCGGKDCRSTKRRRLNPPPGYTRENLTIVTLKTPLIKLPRPIQAGKQNKVRQGKGPGSKFNKKKDIRLCVTPDTTSWIKWTDIRSTLYWLRNTTKIKMVQEVMSKYPVVLNDQKRWNVVATQVTDDNCMKEDQVGVLFGELLVQTGMKQIRSFRMKYNSPGRPIVKCKLKIRANLPEYHEYVR